jgi:hypothetical protein
MNHLYSACQRLRRRLADDLFLAEDLRAHARGWTVEPINSGTGRSYRDPRFDFLHECPGCRGAGFLGIDPCATCAGRGVVDTRRTTTVARAPETCPAPAEARPQGPIHVVAERLDRRVALPRDQEER